MKVFEDVFYEQDEHGIIGFINSNADLEYNIYKKIDEGSLTLENREYKKEELLNLLSSELEKYFINNQSTTRILGHDIRIVTRSGNLLSIDELGDERYEISQAILDGNDDGEVLMELEKKIIYWKII